MKQLHLILPPNIKQPTAAQTHVVLLESPGSGFTNEALVDLDAAAKVSGTAEDKHPEVWQENQ